MGQSVEMNSHTVARGDAFGTAAAGVVLAVLVGARAVDDDGVSVGTVGAVDDEQPISIKSVAPATAVPRCLQSMTGAETRISTVRPGRVSSTLSLKTWVFPPTGATAAWSFRWGRACQLA